MSNGESFPEIIFVAKEPVGFSTHKELDFLEMGDVKLVATYKLVGVEKICKTLTIQREECNE